ncbi:MAG: hypothetical protein K2Q10_03920 [Rhodospirillales bacterium]|nr:hypothetical protein [Rhodospirillales bacterium]
MAYDVGNGADRQEDNNLHQRHPAAAAVGAERVSAQKQIGADLNNEHADQNLTQPLGERELHIIPLLM